MNTIKSSLLLILSSILVVISFSACSDKKDIPSVDSEPSSGFIYPLTDVHVIASGYVNIQKKQNLNSVNDAGKLSPSDLIFTPISEEEAKAKANSFKTGDGFTFFHSTGDEVVPYCNLESVRNIWGTGSIKTVSLESFVQLHVATGTLFFTLKCGSLVDEILRNEWRPGEYIVGL